MDEVHYLESSFRVDRHNSKWVVKTTKDEVGGKAMRKEEAWGSGECKGECLGDVDKVIDKVGR